MTKLESDGWDYGSRPEIYRSSWDPSHPYYKNNNEYTPPKPLCLSDKIFCTLFPIGIFFLFIMTVYFS